MEKLISVIVPVYNGEKYVEKTIDSILNQTYRNLEIVIINDGSTDKTHEIVSGLAEKSDKIRYLINPSSKGVSVARNRGMEIAKGDYLSFVDADDVLAGDFYAILVRNLEESDADIAACRFVSFSGEVPAEADKLVEKEKFDTVQFSSAKDALRSMTGSDKGSSIRGYIWNKVYKRAVVENIRFVEGVALCEDLLFSYAVVSKAKKIVLVKEDLYYYRVYQASSTFRYSAQKTYFAVKVYTELVEKTKDFDEEVCNNFKVQLVNWSLSTLGRCDRTTPKDIIRDSKKNLRRYGSGPVLADKKKGERIKIILAGYSVPLFKLWSHLLKLKAAFGK